MADTLFTQLPVAIALTGTEVVPVDQPNANPPGTFTTKRTTTAAIAQLSASASVFVNQQTGTSYQFVAEDRTKLVSFSNAAPITGTLPATGPGPSNATAAWFVQVENRGAGALTLVPDGVSTIDGASSLVLQQNQGVVLAVGNDYNWYTQRGSGLTAATAVTSVGLALPVSVFNVTVSPITTTGTLTAVLQTQAANSIWAGPTTGAAATPTFRSLVTADFPALGTAGTYGSASLVPVITTDLTGRVSNVTTAAITPGSIGSVAANSLVGNPTGSPAAATSISLGATLAFSGSALQTGAGTGDVTWSANSYATTIAPNAVTFGKLQQVAALSVVGNGTNATANVTAITAGTDGQVLRRSGTTLDFGPLSLSTPAAITGTLPATNGGTGLAAYVVGDILYADSVSSLARLADVATGNALISGGVGTAPSWGKIGLTTHVSGTLPVANGGTGIASATAYAVLCGGTTSTGAFQSVSGVGTSGQVLTSAGAGALPTWQTPTSSQLPPGYFFNFIGSNNTTDATNDFDTGPGWARDDTNATDLSNTSTVVKQIDVAFAEYSSPGTASGGRDSADNLTGAKTFRVYVIGGSGKNTQPFASTSSSPTLPSGFTWKRYRYSLYWTGSAIKPFIQVGQRTFLWTTPVLDINTSSASTSGANSTLTLPTGIRAQGLYNVRVFCAANPGLLYLSTPDQSNDTPSGTAAPLAYGGNTNFVYQIESSVVTSTSAQIRVRVANASTEVLLATLGWIDLSV